MIKRIASTRKFSVNFCLTNSRFRSDDIGMPTPLSMGFDMKFQSAGSSPSARVVVLAGWLGAKERQLKPYLSFYQQNGFDTLSFAVGPWHILYPDRAYKQMEKVLELVLDAKEKRDIVFHHFSVGGFLYGQLLRAIKDQPDRFGSIHEVVKAQIFDSPPDFEGIPGGVSRSMGIGPPFEKGVEYAVRLFLKLNENSSGVQHRASSAAFHDNSILAPALWFYSKGDPVADWRDCVTVTTKWRAKNIVVDECVWEDTPHIQHGRLDPDRYFGTLKSFLLTHKVL